MECVADVSSASELASPCLDLSRRDLVDLPEMQGCQQLKCLYLEGNRLPQLPEFLFSRCPSLQWLDLRNNLLTDLPPSIHLLRDLKTLLLQGNQLTSLPPELGELRQLRGLGLAGNPLSCPPTAMVRRGTSAVLRYLRGQLRARRSGERREMGSGGEGERGSVESGTESDEEYTGLPQQSIKHTLVGTARRPLLLPKQAHIHPHPPPSSPPHLTHDLTGRKERGQIEKKVAEGNRPRQRGGEKGRVGGGKQERVIVHVPPLTSEQKLQANIQIEKQRSKESLEQWRAEAKLDHLKPPAIEFRGPATTDSAPYATELSEQSTQDLSTLTSPHSVRSGEEEMVKVRVRHYNQTLQTQRRQAGLISDASSDLLKAEKRLAEALAQRDEMEERKKREYRLTAFTADPNLL